MPFTQRRSFASAVTGLALATLAAGALSHAPAASAEVKAPGTPAPVTCVGGGTVGQEIDVTITTTLPNGQKGESKGKAKCGADGEWHIVTRTRGPVRAGAIVRPNAPPRATGAGGQAA